MQSSPPGTLGEALIAMRRAADASNEERRKVRCARYCFAQGVAETARGYGNCEPMHSCITLLVPRLTGNQEAGFQPAS